jgi:cyclohexanecarboxylate-CoA ligase
MTLTAWDPQAHASRMRAAGFWRDETIDQSFARAVRRVPNKTALVAYRADQGEAPVKRLTYAQLDDLVGRAAAGLRGLGVAPGDVVSLQLPNWWQCVVAAMACGRLGAVVNPLVPIFRERELTYMLGLSPSKVLIVPKMFRGFDHAQMGQALKADCPDLRHVLVVDGDGPDDFERALLSGTERIDAPAPGQPGPRRADEMALIMFTSGTTGMPKGVMHHCNSLLACIDGFADRLGLREDDVMLACSPLGHMTSYAAVMLQGLCAGSTVVLQDVWNAKRGLAIMAAEGVTHTAGATAFLVDLCEAVTAGGPKPALRSFLCAGAPIPPAVVERAAQVLGVGISSGWGMTESLGTTMTAPDHGREKSAAFDGCATRGAQVKVVDDAGQALPPGQTGRVLARGAQMCMGYFKRPDLQPFDTEGWFESGDLAYMDAQGYIRIDGRTKDLLIRGGEKVPVMEIENMLTQHPAVADVALVGMPDERLGERGCAFVTLRPGDSLDLAAVRGWLEQHKVARQYWPERLEIIEAMPRTASGKIQKFVLREQAKAFAA